MSPPKNLYITGLNKYITSKMKCEEFIIQKYIEKHLTFTTDMYRIISNNIFATNMYRILSLDDCTLKT